MTQTVSGNKDQVWALVDVQSFYTACEQLFDPKLANKPVVVLSNNDGCCVAINAQAKAAGIKRGAVWYKIEREAKHAGVEVRSSNYSLYADMSQRFIDELRQFSPQVEQYSIDEAFIRLDGLATETLTSYGKSIVEAISNRLGLAVRVGIGTSPTLAKLANNAAKRYENRVHGVLHIQTERQRQWLLERMDVQEVWGIGTRLATRLKTSGITTAWQLANQDVAFMRQLWNVGLTRTVLELQGISCIDPGDIDVTKKQILSSRSFGVDITDQQELQSALAFHCHRAGEKLRKQGSQASSVGVYIRTNRYKQLPQHNKSSMESLVCPTQDTQKLIISAQAQLAKMYRPGYSYQKIGVMLNELSPVSQNKLQLDMFSGDALQESKRRDLMLITDRLNTRYKNGLKPASVIATSNWHMRQAFRSNRWTTMLDEIPVAKC
ncbi:Y-family DNA polymerase [Photobacterium sp. WH77]|uniref:Y-family DNA polymerase n=1 Tax=unclassified Photobacterium TaxID=2628852 RepID=UPI001EDAB7E3|nr:MULTISPECIES: Y-family DNA polymerase [unclassified Photobacterium]MCG2837934.1 Y-family DNA polymerase [Photobacterium sp. WH77]MCG2845552.1 Y-family DNA polymerase [Photobacterium sp. WH80]